MWYFLLFIGGGGGLGVAGDVASAGGTGVVIIAYKTAEFTHTGGNSTGTSGSETWVKFTGNGTLTLTDKAPVVASTFDYLIWFLTDW